ncbi:MAG: YjgP/YjgQ family permease [Chitinophagaceae bacterium]|nr:MAG: YjgP/YjgQ family permease [Chitinophagaceae bacterium]
MIKKLDILVVRSFIGPFIATFFITLFVLILQFFWLWIDDFVGKDISGFLILKLIMYLAATLVPLALPLAVLLSSIMTFGNLGETFELVAIKSAGIGLVRFMRPLTIVALLLSGLSFLFNNYVMPVANLKMRTLHTDLVNSKPAFDLKEGEFYKTIPGYAIKVGKKEKDDSTLKNVIIYETIGGLQDNFIVADKGIMKISADKQFMEFTMKDGWWYQEDGQRADTSSKYIRLGFKEYKKMLDMSSLANTFTNDSAYRNRYEMLNIRQLSGFIDSIKKISDVGYDYKKRNELTAYMPFMKNLDSGWQDVKNTKVTAKSFVDLIPDSAKREVIDAGVSQVNLSKSTIDLTASEYEARRNELRMYQIEWHSKFSMASAVLVLFLIGAPLGSIVRKGGIGTPVVFAVIFFVVFFLLNNFGKKFVKQDVMTPFAGIWMASLVLLPIGFFLISKARNDSQILNKEFYNRLFKKIAPLFRKLTGKKKVAINDTNTPGSL